MQELYFFSHIAGLCSEKTVSKKKYDRKLYFSSELDKNGMIVLQRDYQQKKQFKNCDVFQNRLKLAYLYSKETMKKYLSTNCYFLSQMALEVAWFAPKRQ